MNEQTAAAPGPAPESTFIDAPKRWPRLGLDELWRYRSVAYALARRNLKARYRQTLLGIVWVLIQPLSLMIIFSIAFTFILRGGYGGVPYPVFFISGLAIWGPSLKIMSEGTMSLIANQQLVTKVYLPRPLLPGSIALTAFVDLAFTLIALEFVLLLYGYAPSLLYLALPFFILVSFTFMLGLGYFLSALNVNFRDVQVAMPFFERVLFFASPLLYPAQTVPEQWWPLYYLNPMALVLTGFRWVVADMPPPPPYAFAEGTIVAVLVLVGGFIFFRKREHTFADVL